MFGGGCRLASHESLRILGTKNLGNRNDLAWCLGAAGVSTITRFLRHRLARPGAAATSSAAVSIVRRTRMHSWSVPRGDARWHRHQLGGQQDSIPLFGPSV